MKAYIYKLKSNFARNKDLLLNYGFNYCKTEDDAESYYVMPIVLPENGPITKALVNMFEKAYEKANDKSEFSDYEFVDGHVVMTESLKKELTECELCISDNVDDIDKNVLFINAPDKVIYYNSETLDRSAPKVIDKLVKNNIIYKKKITIKNA